MLMWLSFFIFTYFFFNSSLHSLIFLMMVEFMLMVSFVLMGVLYFNVYSCLFFILVGVCLGAYGVSLLVSSSRSKCSYFFISSDFL